MTDYKPTDIHFPLSAVNVGMIAVSALDGNAELMAYNGGLLALNGSLALGGRKDEIREGLSEVPEKALGGVYDTALSDSVRDEVLELSEEKKGGRGNQTSGRRIC